MGKRNDISIATEYVIFASYDHTNCNLSHRLTVEEIGKAFDVQTSEVLLENLYQLACEKNEQKYAVRLPLFRFCFLFSDLVFRRKRFGRFRKRAAMHSRAQLRSATLNNAHLRPAPRGAVGAWSTAEQQRLI